MNIEQIINYLMPSFANAPVAHARSIEEAKVIVDKHLETSCLVIQETNGRYVFEELLCANKTCIDRSTNVFQSIKEIIKNHNLAVNGIRFIFHFKGDACDSRTPFPLLANSRNVGNTNVVLWPLLLRTHFLLTGVRYDPYLHNEITQFLNSPDRIPWDQKQPVFLFRGMNSGNPFPSVTYPWNTSRESRCRLLTESLKLPDELRSAVDIGFNKTYPDSTTLRKRYRDTSFLESIFLKYLKNGSSINALQKEIELVLSHLKPSIPRIQLYRYKYLLCPEGFDCASALSWVLTSNSVAVVPPFHYENVIINSQALRPYVHFLPIKDDYSDLVDVIRWALEHDEDCRKMVINANEYMLPFISSHYMEKVQAEIVRKMLA